MNASVKGRARAAEASSSGISIGPARSSGRPLIIFFLVAFALSWAWVIPLAVNHQFVIRGQGLPTHFPALLGPAAAAFLVVAVTTGRPGIADLLRRMLLWRVGWRWWLCGVEPGRAVAFLGIALFGSWVSGGSLPRLADFGLFSGIPAAGLLPVFLLIVFVGGSEKRQAGAGSHCRICRTGSGHWWPR